MMSKSGRFAQVADISFSYRYSMRSDSNVVASASEMTKPALGGGFGRNLSEPIAAVNSRDTSIKFSPVTTSLINSVRYLDSRCFG